MRNKLAICLILIGLVILTGCLKPSDKQIISCKTDTDCTKAKSGCCGCEIGGSWMAINKKYSSYWDENNKFSCSNVTCPAEEMCFTSPKCVDNKCRLETAKII